MLPPKRVIQSVQWGWHSLWHVMMAQLAPGDAKGAYQRPDSQFRNWIGADDRTAPPERDRYHLIVGISCPWAHRTMIVRALKGLETTIPMEIVVPDPGVGGWRFQTPYHGCQTLREFYQKLSPGYKGRATVPILWDTQRFAIVNNESSELIVMLNSAFNDFAINPELDLYPQPLQESIEQWNTQIYAAVNNGVYRCGMARTQTAYEEACHALFGMLDYIDGALANQRYLCGNAITLADIRLFTTLIRFDLVYYGLFLCNQRRIQDYPHLGAYVSDLYQYPGIAETCDLETIKRDYYSSLFPLNPGGRIPVGPDLSYLKKTRDRSFSMPQLS
jgi:glutathionyl-hydroquinone reductase